MAERDFGARNRAGLHRGGRNESADKSCGGGAGGGRDFDGERDVFADNDTADEKGD
jgi:hypothetical protein